MRELNVVELLNVSAGSDNNANNEWLSVAIGNALLGGFLAFQVASELRYSTIKWTSVGALVGGTLGTVIFFGCHVTEVLIANIVDYVSPQTPATI